MSLRKITTGYLLAPLGVAGVTAVYKLAIQGVNSTTVALSLLLIVLAIASTYGLGPAILASILGMLCFNFFFLPPVGTFVVHDPQNWVALVAFLITAVIASELSSAARQRASEAEKRREEVWKLYELSRAIMIIPDPDAAVSEISRQVLDNFGIKHCEVFSPQDDDGWVRVAAANASGDLVSFASLDTIQQVYDSGEVLLAGASSDAAAFRAGYAPLKIGIKPIGVMFIDSTTLDRGIVEAIAGLVAIALERARFLRELARTEALRQSDELKSAILASVSHDLRTPLTSIRAAVDNLLQSEFEWDKNALREFHSIISEEVDRLTRIVQDLLDMARIEAGEVRPSLRWASLPEIMGNVIDRCSVATRNHRIKEIYDETLPLVNLDPALIGEALTHLIENAAKYSPAGTEIELAARVEGDHLLVSVADQGPGVTLEESRRVFDKFYRSARPVTRQRPGTGMGLAIARGLIEAHGGKIWVESRDGTGACFAFSVPAQQMITSTPSIQVADADG
jgi:two-component system sensor histidine kinase KdpD